MPRLLGHHGGHAGRVFRREWQALSSAYQLTTPLAQLAAGAVALPAPDNDCSPGAPAAPTRARGRQARPRAPAPDAGPLRPHPRGRAGVDPVAPPRVVQCPRALRRAADRAPMPPLAPARAILDAMSDPQLFGRWFGGPSWAAWRTVVAAVFGLPMTDAQRG